MEELLKKITDPYGAIVAALFVWLVKSVVNDIKHDIAATKDGIKDATAHLADMKNTLQEISDKLSRRD
jgi:hypothetical protein